MSARACYGFGCPYEGDDGGCRRQPWDDPCPDVVPEEVDDER